MARLSFFFERLQTGHPFARTEDLEASLDREALAALRAAGLLRPASPLETVPCDDPKKLCFRRVQPAPKGLDTPSPWVGVCKEARGACGPVAVSEDAIAQEELSAPDFVRALRALYAVDARGLLVPGSFARADPVLLGKRAPHDGKNEDEVMLLPRPDSSTLLLSTAATRRRLVLVPTTRGVPPELRVKHGPGSFITIEVLAEALDVEDGRLARRGSGIAAPDAPRGGVKAPSKGDAKTSPKTRTSRATVTAPSGVVAPGASDWTEVRICLVDGETVRIDTPGFSKRFTYADLGMAHTQTRRPRAEWKMLVAICAGGGEFRWRDFGQHQAAKKTVSRLRFRLREIFGIGGDPIATFNYHKGFRAKFWAQDSVPPEKSPSLKRLLEARKGVEAAKKEQGE